MSHKYVYQFNEGSGSQKELLGGKGANLAEMTNLGMPVPSGFTVSTEACTRYYDDGKTIAPEIEAEIYKNLELLEEKSGKKFGDPENPLLVSVRSGARASMPGMMDTILNLGLDDEVAEGMTKKTGNPRFVYDSYRRFVQMFSDVVMEVPKSNFEKVIDELKEEKGVKDDLELDADDMKTLVARFKAYYKSVKGTDFPANPRTQMLEAIKAVFRSWDNPRANVYRRMEGIPYSWGTAVNVQMMVFGNTGENSGTGVAFTRNPETGENKLYGEFLINAQGEDVVAGIRTPKHIDELKLLMPEVYNKFVDIANRLEKHYKDMQDMEFTIEDGTLYMLQTRNGKRTATAALQVAIDLVNEGMIDEKTAVTRVDPKQLDALLHPQFDPAELKNSKPIGKGLAASPGAASGMVVFTATDAKNWTEQDKKKVILVRLETSPEDIEGMNAAEGILTARGGKTSHAAVVGRQMGVCCVVGCGDIKLYEEEKYFTLGDLTIKEGDIISIDGSTGNIYKGKIGAIQSEIAGNFKLFMSWADKYRTLRVRANADKPSDAKVALEFGAEGIGLCRTEHMFFEADRIMAMREMILAKTVEARRAALDKILPFQQSDFEALYEEMAGLPVTIRYLDPPLHEFLPTRKEDIEALSAELNVSVDDLNQVIIGLHEFNPMMGHRGCRLAVSYPEIAEMQTTAVINAAIAVSKRKGIQIVPEIMIPLVGEVKELKYVKDIVTSTADKLIADAGVDLKYHVGTMIEIPRACVTADEIAKEAEFFSFGTNDLTQMAFGFSRDDAAKFLESYYKTKIYESDPFEKLDQVGVGSLVKTAVELGKKTRPDIKLGICGEHGGDPSTVEFCHDIGLSYVSCSPFRVPIARLAAAQAAIKNS